MVDSVFIVAEYVGTTNECKHLCVENTTKIRYHLAIFIKIRIELFMNFHFYSILSIEC